MDINYLKREIIDRPSDWTMFGHEGMFDAMPEVHRQQVHFLRKSTGNYLHQLINETNLLSGPPWEPFGGGNFKEVTVFNDFRPIEESHQQMKKWLYRRGVPFAAEVVGLPGDDDYPFITTWKMVVKYAPILFDGYDAVVFDQTFTWCLYFFHEDQLFFGKDRLK